jgi:hypothetical protein
MKTLWFALCAALAGLAVPLQAKRPALIGPVSLDVIGQSLTITPAVNAGYAVFWCEGFFVRQGDVWARGSLDVQFYDPAAPETRIQTRVAYELPVASATRTLWWPRAYPSPLDVIALEFGAGEPLQIAGRTVTIQGITTKWFGVPEVLDAVQEALLTGRAPQIVRALNELDYGYSLSGLLR